MLKNVFKTAIRNFWRSKGFTIINIAGLSIGMAAAMLILLWVQNEISYDRFHEKTDRISLLYSRENDNGKSDAWPMVSTMLAPALKQEYGEVEAVSRFRIVYFLMTVGDKYLNVQGAFADSSLLSIFSYPLVKGNPRTALNDNHKIVLTQELAIKLFGKQDPIGKTVKLETGEPFTVTGVLKDLPNNTQLEFEYLLPWSYAVKLGWYGESWSTTNVNTYVLLKQGTSLSLFDAKVKNIVAKHVNGTKESEREVFNQPLSRTHLYSKVENGKLTDGRIVTVRLFATIGIFILLIACINFMNLSTARSEKRAKEVGIRKVVGASKNSLILQFIGESILLAIFAFIIALCIVQVSLKGFDQIVQASLSINFENPAYWLSALAFILITGLVAGSYPAFYLSSSKPVLVLKGGLKHIHALITPRKILVVLQFTFAIILIASTIVVEQQIQYARARDRGYSKGNLVYVFAQGDIIKHYGLIKHALLSSGAALSVTKTSSPITRVWETTSGFSWTGSTAADKKINFNQFEEDADFVKTTGTKLLEGRDIDIVHYPTDSAAMMLNESAVKAMRLENPIGKIVQNENGRFCHVVGVIKDFVIESPYDKIDPMVILGPSQDYGAVHFKLNPAHTVSDDLARAEKVFLQYNSQYPFEYVFADEAYAEKFRDEQQEGTLAVLFAGLTIFISCLGLFGLATYMAESRIKEIGIRKVLGASVASISSLLSKDFLQLVMISILIASPIAYFAMVNWLEHFNYRIELGWWVFLLSGLLSIFIAVLAVSYQAIKAATANPIKSLRIE